MIGKQQSDTTLEWFLSHCHIHKYPAKSTLIHQGEKAETLYYILKGSVAVLIKDDEGNEMILSYLNQNQFLGDLAFLDVDGRIAQTLLNLTKQPDAMTHPDGMQIKITRQEIGQIVGCSRETVGRILKMLEDQHLISAHGKTIVVYGTR